MKEMKDYSLSTGDICVQQVADFDRFKKMRKLSLGDEIRNFEIFIITFLGESANGALTLLFI